MRGCGFGVMLWTLELFAFRFDGEAPQKHVHYMEHCRGSWTCLAESQRGVCPLFQRPLFEPTMVLQRCNGFCRPHTFDFPGFQIYKGPTKLCGVYFKDPKGKHNGKSKYLNAATGAVLFFENEQ